MLAAACWFLLVWGHGGQALNAKPTSKCHETPNTGRKVAQAMPKCIETVQQNLIEEAFTILRYQWDHQEHDGFHQPPQHLPPPPPRPTTHHFVRPTQIGTSNELVHHVHHVHRLPGQQHQLQAAYPPIGHPQQQQQQQQQQNDLQHRLQQQLLQQHLQQQQQQQQQLLMLDPRHQPPQRYIGEPTSTSSSSAAIDSDSYFQYQNFDPGMQLLRRRRRRSDRSSSPSIRPHRLLYFRQRSSSARSRDWSPLAGNKATTEISMQEKRIAGCLLHCIFSKSQAVDALGWPTLDGLVAFFTEGVHDHGYFVGALRASNVCLNTLSQTHRVNRWKAPEHGQSCDLSFDVFNCISDRIGEFCGNHPHGNAFG